MGDDVVIDVVVVVVVSLNAMDAVLDFLCSKIYQVAVVKDVNGVCGRRWKKRRRRRRRSSR